MPKPRSTSLVAAPVTRTTSTWRDDMAISLMYPRLFLTVDARRDGVHLACYLVSPDDRPGTGHQPLTSAVWQPAEVTSQLVVEWAYRALRKALEDHFGGTGHV